MTHQILNALIDIAKVSQETIAVMINTTASRVSQYRSGQNIPPKKAAMMKHTLYKVISERHLDLREMPLFTKIDHLAYNYKKAELEYLEGIYDSY